MNKMYFNGQHEKFEISWNKTWVENIPARNFLNEPFRLVFINLQQFVNVTEFLVSIINQSIFRNPKNPWKATVSQPAGQP